LEKKEKACAIIGKTACKCNARISKAGRFWHLKTRQELQMEFDILGLITYNKKMCNDLCQKYIGFDRQLYMT
jgi:hypothetical protein